MYPKIQRSTPVNCSTIPIVTKKSSTTAINNKRIIAKKHLDNDFSAFAIATCVASSSFDILALISLAACNALISCIEVNDNIIKGIIIRIINKYPL